MGKTSRPFTTIVFGFPIRENSSRENSLFWLVKSRWHKEMGVVRIFSQCSSRLTLGAAPIELDWGYGLFASIQKFGLGGDGSAAENGEAAEEAKPAVAAQDTELGVSARLPDVQTGRDGDGEAAADAEPGVAAQDTEPGVAARLPDAKRGGGGEGAAPENG